MRDSFIFYRSFFEASIPLSQEQKAQLFDSICEYALNQNETKREPIVNAMFTLIRPQLDANLTKFENGKKGGRPKEKETETKPKHNQKETETKPKHNQKETETKPKINLEESKPKPNVNVNVNENVNYNDNDNEKGNVNEEKTPPPINPDLKKMINNQKTSGNKVTEIINYYRDNISDRNENIKEQASYNQITLKSYDMDKMLIGLKNYKRYLDTSKKQPQPLFFFIRDDIYKDYQVENAVVIGKNNAIVPADLIGKTFVVDNEKIRFEDDGYYKVDKDWKVTNGENVKDMVELVRSGM